MKIGDTVVHRNLGWTGILLAVVKVKGVTYFEVNMWNPVKNIYQMTKYRPHQLEGSPLDITIETEEDKVLQDSKTPMLLDLLLGLKHLDIEWLTELTKKEAEGV